VHGTSHLNAVIILTRLRAIRDGKGVWEKCEVCNSRGQKSKRVLVVCARLPGGFAGTACSSCLNYLEIEVKMRYYETL